MNSHAQPNGYITLFSILIISAIAVTLTMSILLTGISSTRMSSTFGQSKAAQAAALACAEDAMEQLKSNTNFVGEGLLVLGDNDCTYKILSSGTERVINAAGRAGETIRRTKVTLNAGTDLTIIAWQDVADL